MARLIRTEKEIEGRREGVVGSTETLESGGAGFAGAGAGKWRG
jgi:hypothetical protein